MSNTEPNNSIEEAKTDNVDIDETKPEDTRIESGEVVKKRSIIVRILSILLIVFYLVLLGILIYMIATGSRYIMAMIFVVIMYPVILYCMLWLRNVFSK